MALGPLAGCLSRRAVDLPGSAEETRSAARAQRVSSGARVTFACDEAAEGLVVDRSPPGSFDSYQVPVGAALKASFSELTRLAVDDAPRGAPLTIRLATLQADCSIGERRVVATIVATVVAELEGQELERARLHGASGGPESLYLTLGTPERIREAFAAARLRLELGYLAFLSRLRLSTRGAPADAAPEDGRLADLEGDRLDGRDLDLGDRPHDLVPLGTDRVEPPSPIPPRRTALPPPTSPAEPEERLSRAGRLARVDGALALGDVQGALDAVSAWIRSEPSEAYAYQRRAAIRLVLRDLDAAMADCYRSLELEPELASALVTRGLVYLERGDLERAQRDGQAAESLPKDGATEASLRRLLARLEQRPGR